MSSPEAENIPDSDGWTYSALILLLTIPLSAVVSNAFPLSGVIASVTGANSYDLGPYFVLWQLAFTVVMLYVFYKVGERVDFPGTYRRLAFMAFVGALIGNLPGLYVYNFNVYNNGPFIGFGQEWGYGFGYVTSFGIAEPSSLIDLLTAAVASFMIPLAGLALAHFRLQFLSPAGDVSPGEGPKKTRGPLSPFVVTFLVVVAFLPVTRIASSLFATAPPPTFPYRFTIQQLIPGYAGFLVYPFLLLVAFYAMGATLDMGLWGARSFRRFALSVFEGAVAGLFVIDVIDGWIESSSLAVVLSPYNLARLGAFLLSGGVMVVILAFAALSLGYVARNRPHLTAAEGLPNSC